MAARAIPDGNHTAVAFFSGGRASVSPSLAIATYKTTVASTTSRVFIPGDNRRSRDMFRFYRMVSTAVEQFLVVMAAPVAEQASELDAVRRGTAPGHS